MKEYNGMVVALGLYIGMFNSFVTAAQVHGDIQYRDPIQIRCCFCACLYICCSCPLRKALTGAPKVTQPDMVRKARTFDLSHASNGTQEGFMKLRDALRIQKEHPNLAACWLCFSSCSVPSSSVRTSSAENKGNLPTPLQRYRSSAVQGWNIQEEKKRSLSRRGSQLAASAAGLPSAQVRQEACVTCSGSRPYKGGGLVSTPVNPQTDPRAIVPPSSIGEGTLLVIAGVAKTITTKPASRTATQHIARQTVASFLQTTSATATSSSAMLDSGSCSASRPASRLPVHCIDARGAYLPLSTHVEVVSIGFPAVLTAASSSSSSSRASYMTTDSLPGTPVMPGVSGTPLTPGRPRPPVGA